MIKHISQLVLLVFLGILSITCTQHIIYKFQPDYPTGNGIAYQIEVKNVKDGKQSLVALADNAKLPMEMDLNGQIIAFYPDSLGSNNIKIAIDKDVGYTDYAGLRFKQECTIILIDQTGVIELDKEGIEAIDKHGNTWISKAGVLKSRKAIMIKKN